MSQYRQTPIPSYAIPVVVSCLVVTGVAAYMFFVPCKGCTPFDLPKKVLPPGVDPRKCTQMNRYATMTSLCCSCISTLVLAYAFLIDDPRYSVNPFGGRGGGGGMMR